MKRINKGLLYQQYHSLRTLTILFAIGAAIYSYTFARLNISMSFYMNKVPNGVKLEDFTFLTLVISILLIFSYGTSKRKSMLFLGAAPTTRKDIIYTRTLAVSISTLIVILVDLYMNILVYLNNIHYIKLTNSNYLLYSFTRTFILISISIAFITLFTFAQIIINNSLLAGGFGFYIIFSLCFIPIGLETMINEYIHNKIDIIYSLLDKLSNFVFTRDIGKSLIFCIVVIILGVVLFMLVNVKLFNKINLENSSKIFTSDRIEKIVSWYTSVLVSLWGSLFAGLFISGIQMNTMMISNDEQLIMNKYYLYYVFFFILLYPCYKGIRKLFFFIDRRVS